MMISSTGITFVNTFIGCPKTAIPPTTVSAVSTTAPIGSSTPGSHRNER